MNCCENETQRIERARAGDEQAFSELVLAYQSSLRGFLARTIPDPNDVFDLAQEVFLEAHRNLSRFDSSRDFGRWLRGIARFRAIDHLRKSMNRRKNEIGETDAMVMELQAAAMERQAREDDDEIFHDQLAALRECVGKLDAKPAKLLNMRFFRNMSAASIGQRISRSEGAVRIALMRVKQTLKTCMDKTLQITGDPGHVPVGN